MIIKTLHPISFGRFQNQMISLYPGVNLIEAPNEAGKSTLVAFVSGMLYGFFKRGGKRRDYGENYERYLPWDNPGRYAGSMSVEHQGERYRLERNFLKGSDSVKLVDEITGRDVSERMPLNLPLRIREPGRFFLDISQNAFESTLYVPQQSIRTADALGAELSDKIDAMAQAGSDLVSAAGAAKWLDECLEEIGTPKRSASPLGLLTNKMNALDAERIVSLHRREKAAADSKKAGELREEIDALIQAQADDRAQREQAKQYARWKKAEAARVYDAQVQAQSKMVNELSPYADVDATLLDEAVSSARSLAQDDRKIKDLSSTVQAFDEQIAKFRMEIMATGLDDAKCTLSDALEQSEIRRSFLENDLWEKEKTSETLRTHMPIKPPVESDEAMRLMARVESLPIKKSLRIFIIAGVLLIVLSLLGVLYPAAYALILPGILFLVIGMIRAQRRKQARRERNEMLISLGVSAADEFDQLRRELIAYERAEHNVESAAQAAAEAKRLYEEACESHKKLLDQVNMPDITCFREARARYTSLRAKVNVLAERREASMGQLSDLKEQEGRNQNIVLDVLRRTGQTSVDPENVQTVLTALRDGRRRYDEAALNLNNAKKLLAECLGGESFESLSNVLRPTEIPSVAEEALWDRIRSREEQIQSLTREMDACVARRDAIEDACRTPKEIDDEASLLQEKIDRMTLESEAIAEAKRRIELASSEMRRNLSPALNRAAVSIVKDVTDGRYEKLYIDTDLSLSTQVSGQTVSPDRLSGGTSDLMYLALRLGLIEALMKGREYPVIMDDSFAQMDDERASRMLKIVCDRYQKDGQILLLTCQSRIRETLESARLPHHLIRLQGTT